MSSSGCWQPKGAKPAAVSTVFFGGGRGGRSIFGDFGVFLGNRRRARMALEQKKPH